MKDDLKTRARLSKELSEMRQRINALEALVAVHRREEDERQIRLDRASCHQSALVRLATNEPLISGDLVKAVRAITEAAAEALAVERVSVWMLGEAHGQLQCVDRFQRAEGRHTGEGPLGENDYAAYFKSLEPGKALDAAIRVSGEIVGVVCHEHVGERRIWQGDEIKFAGEIADQVVRAVLSSERKKAQEALRKSEEEYRQIVDNAGEAILVVQEGQTRFFNPRWVELTGFSVEEITANDFIEFVHPDDRTTIAEQQKKGPGEEPGHHSIFRIIDKDGSTKWIDRNSVAITWEGGPASLDFLSDITERKRAEAESTRLESQLRQSQKLETIGTLAGGIAHDFNNVLSPILGYTEMIMEDVPEDSPIHGYLEHIDIAAHRARELIQQILTFSRQVDQERKPVQIQFIVAEALKLLRASLPSTLEMRQHIDPECGAVMADPTQIHQVLMNLCINAYHAMDQGRGLLDVRLEPFDVDLELARRHPNLQEGLHVRLSVSDTGHGMKRETMGKIFEPFFTTKGGEEGTGLGLSVVHGIIVSHGGEIIVYSEPDKGSTFSVFLPCTAGIEEDEEISDRPIPTGNEHVLFVDDEEEICLMGKAMLERLGYEVTIATGGIEAMELFRACPDRFDVVITDQTMPRGTGAELAKELLELNPELPMILATGFSITFTREDSEKLGIQEYIMKPASIRDLGEALRRVLDNAPEAGD